MTSKRICLWSGPRNISTALMYSFAQRPDCHVVDEPLYGYYLSNSKAKNYHPMADEIIESMECNGKKLSKKMIGNFPEEIVLFKQMSHHLLDIDRSFMDQSINIILTRDPLDMIPSFAKVIPNPTIEDIGYLDHLSILNHLKKSKSQTPIVLDSKRLLLDPKKTLITLCDLIGIPYFEEMLEWPLGPRIEDGIWAKHWYTNVHNSTGFQKYKAKEEPFPEYLLPLLQRCVPIYDQLMELSI